MFTCQMFISKKIYISGVQLNTSIKYHKNRGSQFISSRSGEFSKTKNWIDSFSAGTDFRRQIVTSKMK